MNSSNSSDVISSIGLSKFTMKSENCRRPLDHWQSTALYLHLSPQQLSSEEVCAGLFLFYH